MSERVLKIVLLLLVLVVLAILVLPFTAHAQTKNLVFSVQPGITAAIAVGSGGCTVTISGSTATFSCNLPDSVGVGDILVYDANGNGTVENLAVIRGRTSQAVWTVKDSIDGTSGLNTVTADADWSIYRAYTSLQNACDSGENTGIPVGLRDFNIWSGASSLITPNLTMTFACYPGTDAAAVTSTAAITSDATNWLRIYTPYLNTEVGRNMRHDARFTARCYFLSTSATQLIDASTGSGIAHNFTFEGLQLKNLTGDGIYNSANSGAQTFRVDACIFIGSDNTSTLTRHSGIYFFSTTTLRAKITNSVFYNWRSTAVSNTNAAVVAAITASDSVFIYNCTAWDGDRGFGELGSSQSVIAKNCVAGGVGTNWQNAGSWNSNCKYNTDSKSAAPGSNALNTSRPTFVDSTGRDFRLASGDAIAKNNGTDLSADLRIAFTNDINGGTRPDVTTWDRGADEQGVAYSGSYESVTPSPVVLKRRRSVIQ